jgi:hypothetical protein
MKKKLLFTTLADEGLDQGFTYAMDLAKSMDKDLAILLIKNNGLSRFDKLMSAITFAEAGEHETAREFLADRDEKKVEEVLSGLYERCSGAGIPLATYESRKEALPAIEEFLRQRDGIEMVLLGPNVTRNGNISERKLKKLLSLSSRPVVKITQGACAN